MYKTGMGSALPKRILLVEDEKPIRETMKTLLELEGYGIMEAQNGQEALTRLKTDGLPNVILLDMIMPVMNGWDFLDAIKADGATSKIPIVIVSAYGETAKSLRPNAFVPKPVQLNDLLQAVERCS